MTGFGGLPLAEESDDAHDDARLSGVARILGPRWLQLPVLTIGLLGVQVFWSIEMSYGTPYLISLGLSKSAVATVFLAGPVSGLIVQPLIGVLADNSKSRFGRRRPYILAGTAVCVLAMLLLGFTRPVASIFTTISSKVNNILTIWLAILALFAIDFSINAVQAVDRALIIDTLPPAQQPDGNAWAARMLGVGSVAGYFIGNVDLTTIFPFLGNTELEVLAILGSLLLVGMHLVTAVCTKERVVVASKAPSKNFVNELREIVWNARHLPSVIRQICIIQFCAWIGWFPVLFYTTEFVAELHQRAHPSIPADDPELSAEGMRLGSRALFYNALLSLAANFILPFFVSEATGSRRLVERKLAARTGTSTGRWAALFARVQVHLATLWAVSHLAFAVCMAATFFYSSVAGATLFTTLTGFSWSITQWAPFSLLAEAILTEDLPDDTASIMLNDTRTQRRSPERGPTDAHADDERQFLVGDAEDEEEEGVGLETEVRSFRSSASMDSERDRPAVHQLREAFMNNANARLSHLDVHGGGDDDAEMDVDVGLDDGPEHVGGGLAARAGIIIGIHNIFVVMPQFIMTGIASIIFLFLDPSKAHDPSGTSSTTVTNTTVTVGERMYVREDAAPATNSYAIVFRLGGIAAAIAFILTVRLARELRLR